MGSGSLQSPYTAGSTSDPKALSVTTATTNAFTKHFTDLAIPPDTKFKVY
jgi:hypothetical protein